MQTKAKARASKAKAAKADATAQAVAASGIVAVPALPSFLAPALLPVQPVETPVQPVEAPEQAPVTFSPRAVAKALYTALNASVSVPVKPLSTFKAYRPALGAMRVENVTPRCAAAVVIAAVAAGAKLPVAGEPAVTFSRRFHLGNVAYAIENGASADAVSAGAASYDSASETFTVTAKQAERIAAALGAATIAAFDPAAIAAAMPVAAD